MAEIRITKVDEVYVKVESEPSIERELVDFFTFDVPNAHFIKSRNTRMRGWSGKIYLYSAIKKLIFLGLIHHIKVFAKERNISIVMDEALVNDTLVSVAEFAAFVKKLDLTKEPRDYQLAAALECINTNRKLILSPTASGKSLIIFMLVAWYLIHLSKGKILIIVPTLNLVHQMASDFVSYGFPDNMIHKIFGGEPVDTNKRVVISTWQSIYERDTQFFSKFVVTIGDEAHLYRSKSLTMIMKKLKQCKHKFGFTGTLDNMLTNKLVCEGLFGDVYITQTTKQLIERKNLATLNPINVLVFNYPDSICQKIIKEKDYQAELDFIVTNEYRNNYLKNLALNLKGNTLMLFNFVDKHGKVLYELMKQSKDEVYMVYGGVDGEEREEIRRLVQKSNNADIIASYATFSTGTNIPNLNNLILASPVKSKIRLLQSIGRILRLGDDKTHCTLFDCADDLRAKGKMNTTLTHLQERMKLYDAEGFDYKVINIPLYKGNELNV